MWLKVHVVLQDGGCTCPGDVSKAFGKIVFLFSYWKFHEQLVLFSLNKTSESKANSTYCQLNIQIT